MIIGANGTGILKKAYRELRVALLGSVEISTNRHDTASDEA